MTRSDRLASTLTATGYEPPDVLDLGTLNELTLGATGPHGDGSASSTGST